jgi:hypothetical protein
MFKNYDFDFIQQSQNFFVLYFSWYCMFNAYPQETFFSVWRCNSSVIRC